jgi:hypothetical protein
MLMVTQLAGFGAFTRADGPKSLSFISTSGILEGIRKNNVSSSPSTTRGTISMWVKPVAYDANEFLTFMSFGSAGGGVGLSISGEGGSCSIGNTGNESTNITPPIALNTWAHLVFQIDTTQSNANQANRLKLFVNGTQTPENAGTSYPSLNQAHSLFTNGAAVTIGPVQGTTRQGRCKIAFIDVLETVQPPTDFAFSNGGVWTRKPYAGAHTNHSYSLDGRLGFAVTGGLPANNFTPLAPTSEAANLDASDLPPFTMV